MVQNEKLVLCILLIFMGYFAFRSQNTEYFD